MIDAHPFEKDWSISPGATVRDIMSTRAMDRGDTSALLDFSPEDLDDLIQGAMPIDADLAERLAEIFGPSKPFWLRREKLFRQANEGVIHQAQSQKEFISQLPLRDMKAFGWLDKYGDASNKEAAVRFFEDAWGDWRRNGRDLCEAVAFRTSASLESHAAPVAAWLRQGVIQAQSLDCAAWNPTQATALLAEVRPLTRIKDPAVFFPQLVEICRRYGIAAVFVRTPTGCRASGATHFTPEGTPIMQLSFRYRSDDHFWFTVFHEIGHLALHSGSPMFVEGQDYIPTQEETEADEFAQNALVPELEQPSLYELGSNFRAVMRFARRIGVSAGIVVGQMQKREIIRYNQLNFLKERYDWSEMKSINP
ncbi:ImmA/IrrE family metallo-endopeptidase [Brevundimonas sp.]|uniref:ImmA/IrrE family metallo-endopeptidase n=1 Tax=Brevundimonas sp. TaxID=1871086 RepID=UPI002C34EA82|nr:ImmA/IrrE family metallo-endopeptidase [Brevundimonas sp.]HWQ85821.1 ImmA/IrrE family metallo-endopeptidase [Brevundimonas sp.]